jgi:hypothetical protein
MFGRNQAQLPTASGGNTSRSFFASADDGSARSIHLQNPIVKQWKRSSRERKITYISMVSCLLSLFIGWRWLMYYSAYLNINCNSTDCFLKLAGTGRFKKVNLQIPRHQISAVNGIKVSSWGVVQEDKVNMNNEWKQLQKTKKGKKQKNSAINSYKGPDENGHYLSYAVILKDKGSSVPKTEQDGDQQHEKLADLESSEKDLSELVGHFGERLPSGEVRISMRQFGATQTHRRVRNMVSKLDSYISKRRQKLTVRESAPANWKAILMIVFGLVGFLISILIGLFWDENDEGYRKKEGGPGARRRDVKKKEDNPYGMPSRYEVSTQPNVRSRATNNLSRRR